MISEKHKNLTIPNLPWPSVTGNPAPSLATMISDASISQSFQGISGRFMNECASLPLPVFPGLKIGWSDAAELAEGPGHQTLQAQIKETWPAKAVNSFIIPNDNARRPMSNHPNDTAEVFQKAEASPAWGNCLRLLKFVACRNVEPTLSWTNVKSLLVKRRMTTVIPWECISERRWG